MLSRKPRRLKVATMLRRTPLAQPVERILKLPLFWSIIDCCGLAVSDCDEPLAGSSSMANCELAPGTLRHVSDALNAPTWLRPFGDGRFVSPLWVQALQKALSLFRWKT